MEAQKRLELLKRQREELISRRAKDLEEKAAALALKGGRSDGLSRGGHAESAEIPQLRQRQEHRRLALSVGTMCVAEEIRERGKAVEEEATDDSAEDNVSEASSRSEHAEEPTTFRVLAQEEADEFVRDTPRFLGALRAFEARLKHELHGPRNRISLIEDYIYRDDNDVREQHGGYAVRRYPDADFRGHFAANDVAFLGDAESDRIAVAYALAPGGEALSGGHEHALAVYAAERRLVTKHCRNEIKRIAASPHEGLVLGGLDSGKVAVWDVRSQRALPELSTKLSPQSNYLPVIDLHTREYFVYCVGLEGRLCKWDMRHFEEPVLTHDVYCENDHITRLEAMPLGMLADPREEELFHVNTVEGSVYTVSMAGASAEQRASHLNLHEAPIVQLQCLDVAGFLGEAQRRLLAGGAAAPPANFFLSASFDWNIKIFRGGFDAEESRISYHREFVTALEANGRLNPFVFASADAEGKVAVWRLDQPGWSLPLYQWSSTAAVHRLAWSPSGRELAAVDAKGRLHVLNFPRSKLALTDNAVEGYLANGVHLSFKA